MTYIANVDFIKGYLRSFTCERNIRAEWDIDQ